MLVSKEVALQLENFNKYARFISNHFGVTVQYEGTEACTNGRVVKLPAIMSMSPKEIDFLYGVLLHEIGHILYSTFTKEAFGLLITKAHAHLANAIEDARVEKLLMASFDGAKDIFHKLYNEHTQDKELMNKVFHCSLTDCDEWHALGIYVHNKILNLPNSIAFETVVGKKVAPKIIKFIKANKLDEIISSSPLVSWTDVVTLTNTIYDLYFSSKKDKSEKNIINEQSDVLSILKDDHLAKLATELDKTKASIAGLTKKIAQNKEKIKTDYENKKPEIDKLEKEIRKCESRKDLIEEYSSIVEDQNDKLAKEQTQSQKLVDLQDRSEKLSDKIKELEAVVPSEEDLEAKAAHQQKLDKLKARAQALAEKQTALENRLQKTKDKVKGVQELEAEIPSDIKALTQAERDSEVERLSSTLEDLREKLDVLTEHHELEYVNQQLNTQINGLKESLTQSAMDTMQTIQQILDDAGIDANVIPGFEKNEGWDEADKIQQEFDAEASKETGKVVINGTAFGGSSTRDILAMVEKAGAELAKIDLAEHFKANNQMSKLESFNEMLSEVKYSSNLDSKSQKAIRAHVPATTKFDVVKTETKVKDAKEFLVLKGKVTPEINKIKSIFRQRLKFSKKDWFKGNKEEGSLDNRSIWKLATKMDDNYYEINRPKYVNKVAASIALDISGSMEQNQKDQSKKLSEVALLVSEGLTECFIRHEIAGFHAPVCEAMRAEAYAGSYNRTVNNLETVIFKSFKDKSNSGIGNIEVQCTDNSDGESLKIIAKRLLKESSRRKVMFIITDGKSFLSNSDVSVLDKDLKDTLLWLSKNKIEVFAFGFNDQPKDFYGDRYCKVTKLQDVLDFCNKKLG